ncbi:MAG: putative transporter [Vampirovibrionales bacterium]|nr:putative transporter [Vampirovibrionales bacterium]
MDWLVALIDSNNVTVAHSVLVLCLVTALGLALGSIRIGGVGLGTAGVLFSGLLFGHLGIGLPKEVLEFVREFGLILFVYTIGMQVGPGFLEAFKKHGLLLNSLAAAVVLLGVGITLLISLYGGVPLPAAVGLFSGATTNTPSLAAAQQALTEASTALTPLQLKMPGMAYAVAYPFGIMGIILTMLLIRFMFRINPLRDAQRFIREQRKSAKTLQNLNVEVTNSNVAGLTIAELPFITDLNLVISRILHGAHVELVTDDTRLELGDVLHAVGAQEDLKKFVILVGQETETDLKTLPTELIARPIVVTRRAAAAQTIGELNLLQRHNVQVTRVTRGDVQLTPRPDLHVQFGDILLVVGEPHALDICAKELGNSLRELNFPQVVPIFVGIALGVVLGSYPMFLPSIPAPVKLGMAGGPLIVALLLSKIGNVGRLNWYLHPSSNFILRELGIILFLACVGIHGGDRFVSTLTHGDGLYWMAMASIITLAPLLIVGLIGRGFFKLNYTILCGLLAGSMTDPPALAFATAAVRSDAPNVSYSTVYPLVMILRIIAAQVMVLVFLNG